MASVMSAMPNGNRGRARGSSWLTPYLDGQVWRLVKGVDFNSSTRTVQTYVPVAARRLGIKATTAVRRDEPDVIYVQAHKP